MIVRLLQSAAVATAFASAVAVSAQTTAEPTAQAAAYELDRTASQFAQFVPRQTTDMRKIDYSHWDKALEYFVYPMGRSIRKAAPPLQSELGTRLIYGHDSRLRLEGNRVAFSFLDEEQIAALIAYREDLEKTAGTIDITSLPRNEQLAFWLNLHNVAVIEQIARAYPLHQPSRMKIGGDRLPLDEAKIVTVSGVALSPRDIRTKIVYPNWNDARVIYGFFRGEIGGPTIQRTAFNSNNLGDLLNRSAVDFVNSLRGTEKRGKSLHVSTIYDEAAPFFFRDFSSDLKTHLRKFSTDNVRSIIDKTSIVRASIYEADISDLANGERDPGYGYVIENSDPNNWGFAATKGRYEAIGVPRNISRLVEEKQDKYRYLLKRRELRGEVIFLDDLESKNTPGEEIE